MFVNVSKVLTCTHTHTHTHTHTSTSSSSAEIHLHTPHKTHTHTCMCVSTHHPPTHPPTHPTHSHTKVQRQLTLALELLGAREEEIDDLRLTMQEQKEVSKYMCLYVSLCASMCLYVSLCVSMCLYCACVCVCVCLCVFVCEKGGERIADLGPTMQEQQGV